MVGVVYDSRHISRFHSDQQHSSNRCPVEKEKEFSNKDKELAFPVTEGDCCIPREGNGKRLNYKKFAASHSNPNTYPGCIKLITCHEKC